MNFRTRFAPSPTGPLHLGHAYSALTAQARAEAFGGEMLLRIEDLDQTRARRAWEEQIHVDLSWLGIRYPRPVLRQSDRLAAYDAALAILWSAGLLYPCTCTRRDIAEASAAPQEGAPAFGPDGMIYPGTCRASPTGDMPRDTALRLDMRKALERVATISFLETGEGPGGEHGEIAVDQDAMLRKIGDVALRRPGLGAAYHLAVVVDDAAQQVTEVVRGQDLFAATPIHVLLHRLLGSPVPQFHHHRLIRDAAGKRLAKRDDAQALAAYREAGITPDNLRCRLQADTPWPTHGISLQKA